MKRKLFLFSLREKILLSFFLGVSVLSVFFLWQIFYAEHTRVQPAPGGDITEVIIGNLSAEYTFNPLFAEGIEQDVSQLLFSGLMQYNPATGETEDHLATHTLSPDKRTYEFTIKEGIVWHDGTPLTASDVYFTFHDIIQNEDFPGSNLKKTFEKVEITQLDERTVRFVIPEKRKTFFTNFTQGILPKHLLGEKEVANILNDPFSQSPIGSGPYRFEGVFIETVGTIIKFSAFEEYFQGTPQIQNISFQIVPTQQQAKTALPDADALRPVRSQWINDIPRQSHFIDQEVTSPRYVSVAFNLQDATLSQKKLRQAMRASTNTDNIAKKFSGDRIDTPLVELWSQNNIVNISSERATELLNEGGFLFPEQQEEEPKTPPSNHPPEKESDSTQSTTYIKKIVFPTAFAQETAPENTTREVADNRYVFEPSKKEVFITNQNTFYIIGSVPKNTLSVRVNGYTLTKFSPEKNRFSYQASTGIQTLTTGKNTYSISFRGAGQNVIDTEEITVFLEPNDEKRQALMKKYGIGTKTEMPEVPAEEQEKTEESTEEGSEKKESKEEEEQEEGDTEEDQEIKKEEEEKKETEEEEEKNRGEGQEDIVQKEEEKTIFRLSPDKKPFSIRLTYLKGIPYLQSLAETLRKDWNAVGIDILLDPLSPSDLRESMEQRTYQLLLLPQHLGYNLDIYPFFHLSQAEKGGFNLSYWKNLKASLLLEEIRATHDAEKRFDSLSQLRDIIIDDVPAIFLYSPRYIWRHDKKIKNTPLVSLALLSDRYANVHQFYIQENRELIDEVSFSDFFHWIWEHTTFSSSDNS